MTSKKDAYTAHVKLPFLSPLRGWLSFYFFTRGITPGYRLSALRDCCRAKRLFALHEKAAEVLILSQAAIYQAIITFDNGLYVMILFCYYLFILLQGIDAAEHL